MSKTVTISLVSLFMGVITTLFVIYAIDFYKIKATVVEDHKALTEVVNFINSSIGASQQATTNTRVNTPAPVVTE